MNNGSRTGDWEKFLHSNDWKRTREQILRRDGYMDQYVKATTGRIISGNIVHHILPKEKFPQWALSDWNLITVSENTHRHILHNKNGALTKAGEALMRETAERNHIDLQRVTMVIGLPGAGKTTWVRQNMGSEGLAYDLDAIAMAFRLREPHAERSVPARRMAAALFKAFAQRASEYSPDVYLIRTAGNVDELSMIRPDRLVILRTAHDITDRKDYTPIDLEPLEESIQAQLEWCKSNGIEVIQIPPLFD